MSLEHVNRNGCFAWRANERITERTPVPESKISFYSEVVTWLQAQTPEAFLSLLEYLEQRTDVSLADYSALELALDTWPDGSRPVPDLWIDRIMSGEDIKYKELARFIDFGLHELDGEWLEEFFQRKPAIELLSYITIMDLSSSELDNEAAIVLAKYVDKWAGTLLEVSVYNNPIDSVGLAELLGAGLFDSAVFIDIGFTRAGFDGVRTLMSSERLLQVRGLRFRGLGLGFHADGLVGMFGEATIARQLVSLDLSDNGLDDETIVALLQGGELENLNRIDLSNNWLTDETLMSLVQNSDIRSLRELEFHGNQGIVGPGVVALTVSGWANEITHLGLGREGRDTVGIGDDVIQQIFSEDSKLRNLQCLDLKQRKIGNSGLSHLVKSEVAKSVRFLNLTHTEITSEGVVELMRAKKLPNLVHLFLGFNELNETGIRAIAESTVSRQLRALNLEYGRLGNNEARILACSQHLQDLQILVLRGNKIGDVGAKELVESENLIGLKVLDLSRNSNISTASVPKLRKLGKERGIGTIHF